MKAKNILLLAFAAILTFSFTFISASKTVVNTSPERASVENQQAPIGGTGVEEITR